MGGQLVAIDWLARSAGGGLVFLAAAAVAVRLCRQPADRVRVIGLALVGALVVPWVALVPGLPRWSVEVLPADTAVSAAPQPERQWAIEPVSAPASIAPPAAPSPEMKAESSAGQSAPPAAVPASEPAPTVPGAEPAAPEPARSWSPTTALFTGYVAAAAVMFLWSLLGLARLALLRRNARPAPAEAVGLLREIAGPRADRVRLLISDRVDAPLAFLGLRPVVVLPAALSEAVDRDALRYGLAHEWSHVERGDLGRWYLATLAQALLFYQPLFWWLRRQLRLAQDYLADARAAGQAADPADYAEYLVALARRRLGVPGPALGITDRRPNLTRRVHMLLLNRTPLRTRGRPAWTAGAVAIAVGLLVGLAAVRLSAADPPKDDAKKPAGPTAKGESLNYTGRVTDKATGKPVAKATVTVRRSVLGDPEQKERNPVLEESKHTTDADGKYSFTIPPEQSSQRYLYIELDVAHPDYGAKKGFGYALSMIRKNERLGERPFFEHVELNPAKPVTGVVRTPDGKPAAGVKVQAYSVAGSRSEGRLEIGSFDDTRTDAEGRFRLPLATPGWAVLWVLPEGYVPTTHVLQDKRGDLGTFTLRPGPRLRGRLLDAKGQPLAGVVVNAESRDRNEEITEPVADNINRSAVTDGNGEFVMNPLPPGTYAVKPGDYARDGSLDRKDRKRAEVPAVFTGTKVVLKDGVDPEPLAVRAVPHVTIEAQYVDSKGKPTRGHAPHLFGKIDGDFWFGEAKADANGKVTIHVPHGLEDVQLSMMTNEHGSLKWRKAKGEPLNTARRIMLGTVTEDVKGIEIVRYTAPILLVKLTTADGSKPANPAVTAVYATVKTGEGRFVVGGGRQSDVSFEKQDDGRFRSSQLFPDDEVTLTGHADGYVSKPLKVKVPEGETKEVELVLEKGTGKGDGPKQDDK